MEQQILQRRWLAYQLFSIVLAIVLLALTWDTRHPWSTQAITVPLVIAVSPSFLRPSFLRARIASPIEERRNTVRLLIIGLVLFVSFIIAVGWTMSIEWNAIAFIIGAGIVTIGIPLVVLVWRRPAMN